MRDYKGTPALAAKGFITRQIGIHGIPAARSFIVEPQQVHLSSEAQRGTIGRRLLEHVKGRR